MANAKNWCFTINNPHPYDADVIKAWHPDLAQYVVYGNETGESGTPHLQGYVQFTKKKRLTALKKLHKEAHWEAAKADFSKNYAYCTKDGDFVEHGTHKKAGAPTMESRIAKNKRLRDTPLTELVDSGELSLNQVPVIQKARIILAQENSPFVANDVRGEWIWGPPGTGKTRSVWDLYGDDLFDKPQSKWFCGYAGEKTILIDDMDSDCLGHYLKRWADRYPCSGEIKGGTVNLQHHRLIVTSNFSIESLFDKPEIVGALKRRFKITHMPGEDTPAMHPLFTPNS